MPARLGVQILGDAAGLKAALGASVASFERFQASAEAAGVGASDALRGATGAAERMTAAFAGMSTEELAAAVRLDTLAMAASRYEASSLGMARATLAFQKGQQAAAASQAAVAEKSSARQLAAARTLGRGLTTYVSLPVAAIGYEAVKMGVQFQRQMLLIRTQAGDTTDSVKGMSNAVLQLAKVSPEGPIQLAQGLYHLVSIGLRGQQALDVLRTSAMAAGMGMADLETVSTALGAAMVTGIQGAQSANQAMGILNATVGAGNMRMQDLADALGTEILPKAKNAGVSLDEVGAALAVLTDRGVGAQKAATQLGTTFALMMAPSNPAKKALADLGINVNTLRDDLAKPNGLLTVLETLRSAMDRVGKQRGATDILSAFGRSRQSGAILTLVESLGAGISDYQHKLDQVRRTEQQFSADQQTYMQSPSYKLHSSLSTVEADMIKLGDALTPVATTAAKTFAEAVDKISTAFSKLPEPIKQGLGVEVALLAIGGPVMLALLKFHKAVQAIGTAFGGIPKAAAPALATTDAEVSSSMVVAESKVAGLRSSLVALGALTIAPIVIPIEYDFAKGPVTDFFKTHLQHGIGAAVNPYIWGGKAGDWFGPSATNLINTRGQINAQIAYAKSLLQQGQSADAVTAALEKRYGMNKSTAEGTVAAANDISNRGVPGAVRGVHPSLAPTTKPGTTATGAPAPFDTFVETQIPYRLRLAQAKAAAEGNTTALEQADAAMKKWLEQMVGEHRYVGQGLIDALNYETTLSDKATTAANKEASSAKKEAEAAKKAREAKTQAWEEHLLGMGPSGAPVTPGAEALMAEERKTLIKALAGIGTPTTDLQSRRAPKVGRNIGFGRVPRPPSSGSATAQEIAAETAATSKLSLQQLVDLVEKTLGDRMPKSTRESLAKINEILKQDFIPPDVRENIRQRLSEIAATLETGLKRLTTIGDNYVAESASNIVKNLPGHYTHAQKVALEQKFAQLEAHGGKTPTAGAAGGVPITINIHESKNPQETAKQVIRELNRRSRHTASQTRGRHGGRILGLA